MAMATLKRHRSCSTVHLPEEIVIEILMRLPVKSLLRCLSVCRLWHSIIKSTRFINNHRETNPNTGLLVYFVDANLVYEHAPFRGVYTGRCSVFPPDEKLGIYEELDHGTLPGRIQFMCGPFNGILFVQRRDRTLALWNPATRGLRNVPPCPLRVPLKKEYGFGIDPLTDSLKIVGINIDCDRQQFALYDSRIGSWRFLEDKTLYDIGFFVLRNDYGQPFSNGCCYWIKRHNRIPRKSILAFDMRNDSFQEFEMPPEIIKPGYKAKLDLCNGTLALMSYHLAARRVETWIMKEKGRWEQLSSMHLSFEFFDPVGILNRNEIYVFDGYQRLIVYDTDSRHERNVEYNRVRNALVREVFAHTYKESLTPV